MIAWWELREPRERLLIMLAALLTIVVLVQQFLIRPLLSAQVEARTLHERAAETLDIVAADAQAIAAARLVTPTGVLSRQALTGDALRAALTGLAAQRGLEISRLQTTPDGGFSINMENADPQLFFEWLAEAEAAFGAQTQSASITKATNGQVRITIDFAGSPA
jgi:type II secretory pathway component PulM